MDTVKTTNTSNRTSQTQRGSAAGSTAGFRFWGFYSNNKPNPEAEAKARSIRESLEAINRRNRGN